MKVKPFYIGLILIIISFTACVISFYLLVFCIPIFFVGAMLIMLSKQKMQTKLLMTLTPIVLYIPSTFLFLYAYNYSAPKTILIPEHFYGTLRVVYEEKCGNNYKKIDGVKTLIFPENGILILSEDFDRHINYNYYLVDKLGNRTEIPQIFAFSDKFKKSPCVFVGGSGNIGQTTEANSNNQFEKVVTYSDFSVYNKDSIDRSDYKIQQKFDSLTLVIANQCRQQQ